MLDRRRRVRIPREIIDDGLDRHRRQPRRASRDPSVGVALVAPAVLGVGLLPREAHLELADRDTQPVAELHGLTRLDPAALDRRAVGRAEIRERSGAVVEVDLGVPTRHEAKAEAQIVSRVATDPDR
jgi:hypothetical protein